MSTIPTSLTEKQFDGFYNNVLTQSKALAMLKTSAEKESAS